ncbi:MAG: pitrilysin family protein [Lentimicrobium sp.]|jgi:zinc protease|nr:pitrilysin family protein [Lentimicrobium sp.]
MQNLSGIASGPLSVANNQLSTETGLKVDYEKYKLENGLEIILHQEHANPIVAVAILYHVGSSREKSGKTGFAHFFEHMLFQNSENVGKGEFFRKIDDLGGTFNGGTWNDGTVYYEVVPKDSLEKILWMESDRMGFLINTVTQQALEREKDIVINEKRQRVDNQPYGHTGDVIDSNLYKAGHPYSWQVIGSMDDIRAASLEDVKEFYDAYYGVNNATMVIAGDFDSVEVKHLIDRYFGEFKPRRKPKKLQPQPSSLAETKLFFHEDAFARLPELNIVFPAVEVYHPDMYPLEILADLLAEGKKAPLYKEVVEKRKLAPAINVFNHPMELAGKFQLNVRAFEGIDLNEVLEAINAAFMQFENDVFKDSDLQRIKNLRETSFYNSISSILGKSFQLSQASVFGGEPSRMMEDIRLLNEVTREDVMRVYEKYLKNALHLATSFVPKGRPELALKGSLKAVVVEEAIGEAPQAEEMTDLADEIYDRTPSTFDRSVEPAFGPAPLLNTPEIYVHQYSNGMKLLGIEHNSLPLVQFSIRLKGGLLLDPIEKPGVARLLSGLMMEGTARRTPEELEEAIGQLGATIDMQATPEYIELSANCLVRNYHAVKELVEEILLQPRWDGTEFERLKQSTLARISERLANPNAIALNVFNRLIYGDVHIFSKPVSGDEDSVKAITMDDLKDYYRRAFSPAAATWNIAGAIKKMDVITSFENLGTKWQGNAVNIPEYMLPGEYSSTRLYFVDVPDAKQSVVLAGSLSMPRNHPDYFPAAFVNYKLGEGSGSRLFSVLRLEKGYTYGAYSFIVPRAINGTFIASSSVQSMFTLESVQLFNEILSDYCRTYTVTDLEVTRGAIIRSNAGKFETLHSLMSMLGEINSYSLPVDYIKQEQLMAATLTLDKAKAVFDQYVRADQMIYVVVGDAQTQFERLKDAGLGEPVLIDKLGNRV